MKCAGLLLPCASLLLFAQTEKPAPAPRCDLKLFDGHGERGVWIAFAGSRSLSRNDPSPDGSWGAPPPGSVKSEDTAGVSACVWRILESCPWHPDLPMCKGVGSIDRPGITFGNLLAWQGACGFRASAISALPNMKGDRGARLCVALVAAGGSQDCLPHYRREIVREFLHRRRDDFDHTDHWLSPYLARFWMPQYSPLLPWLRSLPETSSQPGYVSLRSFAIGFHAHDDAMIVSAFGAGGADLQLYDWAIYKYRPKTDWLGLLEKSGLKPEWMKAIREAHERNQHGAYQSLHMVSEFDAGYCADSAVTSAPQSSASMK